MSKQVILTGLRANNDLHIGNYFGALLPLVDMAKKHAGTYQINLFMPDLHSFTTPIDHTVLQEQILHNLRLFVAAGLPLDNPDVHIYRQSYIPAHSELTVILNSFTGFGEMSRMTQFKDKSAKQGESTSLGLFGYPVLMAADILMFRANRVPVGRDQVQHLEMARDFAARFNHIYGEHFVLPEVSIEENVATLPGLDGRKMSKSYDNTIPLFAPRNELLTLIKGIKTDSRAPGEPKETEGSALFQLYQAFATAEETEAMRRAFADGIAWGEAKQQLFDLIDAEIGPMRARYDELMAHPERIEEILMEGAAKARAIAGPLLGLPPENWLGLDFACGEATRIDLHDWGTVLRWFNRREASTAG